MRNQPKHNIEIRADDHAEERLRHPRRGTGSAKQRAKILDDFRKQNDKRSRAPMPDADRNPAGSGLSSIHEEPPREDPSSWLHAAKGDGSNRQRGDHSPSAAAHRASPSPPRERASGSSGPQIHLIPNQVSMAKPIRDGHKHLQPHQTHAAPWSSFETLRCAGNGRPEQR